MHASLMGRVLEEGSTQNAGAEGRQRGQGGPLVSTVLAACHKSLT